MLKRFNIKLVKSFVAGGLIVGLALYMIAGLLNMVTTMVSMARFEEDLKASATNYALRGAPRGSGVSAVFLRSEMSKCSSNSFYIEWANAHDPFKNPDRFLYAIIPWIDQSDTMVTLSQQRGEECRRNFVLSGASLSDVRERNALFGTDAPFANDDVLGVAYTSFKK